MVHVVGIVGINGNVGAPTVRLLAKAAQDGKIKLVILHREGSLPKDLSGLPNVESRVLRFEDPAEKIDEAVRGMNVFISAVGFGALPMEHHVVDALARSRDMITYIPSTYSTTWEPKDFEDENLGPVLKFLHGGWDRAKERGLGVTVLYIGVFENYWFEYGFVGSPLKPNIVWANEKQLKQGVPISVRDHVAAALTRIATSDPQSIKNKEFSAVTFWPTGQELVDLYTNINGTQAQIKDWTPADRDAINADGANFGPAKVGYWDRWESGDWGYAKNGRIVDSEYRGPGLEEVVRKFL